jgi:AcrR family transcriptional regulator
MRFLSGGVNGTVRYGQEFLVMSLLENPAPASKRDTRRETILDVAREVFLAEGYASASMSTIAARLGGSKGTLYNYFKSKEDLFEACVSRHCAWQSEAMFSILVEGMDLRAALNRIGRNYLALLLSDNNLAMFRLVVAEADRDPEIGKLFYESGPRRGLGRMAEFLVERAGQGELVVDDPLSAANVFVALCKNRLMTIRLCNYAPEPSAAEIESEVRAAVDTFLKLFAPARSGA